MTTEAVPILVRLARLGLLTGELAKRATQGNSGSERLQSLGQVLQGQLGPLPEWHALPLVIRATLRSGSKDGRTYLKMLPRRIALAPPNAHSGTCGEKGSFLLLDLDQVPKPVTLTVVLYDWDALKLSRMALAALGVPVSGFESLLHQGSRPRPAMGSQPDGDERTARWRVYVDDASIAVTTGALDDDELSPRVGRFALGALDNGWRVEVLALPRLSDSSPCDEELVCLGDDPEAAREFLRATVWRRGAPTELMALMELSHQTPILFDSGRVRLQATEDPSPLAWLALAEALEDAAQHQRRQYVRVQQDARAPTGTLRVGAYVGNLARGVVDTVPVSRFLLCHDTLENRLLRGTAAWLQRRTRRDGALGAWMAHRFALIEAAFEHAEAVEPELWMCDALADRELPEPIARAVSQIRHILQRTYPGLGFAPGAPLSVTSFELVIADLFEAAARQILSQALGRSVLDGNVVAAPHGLKWLSPGGGSNRLKPDFLVMRGRDEVVGLGDAKYKRPSDRSSYWPLIREDFHQVATYLLAWPQARWGVVLLPQDDMTESPTASRQLATLSVPSNRELGVFKVSPAMWLHRNVRDEPLTCWLQDRVGR